MASIQDRIVRELDVYVSGFAEQEGHQVSPICYETFTASAMACLVHTSLVRS